MNDAGVCQNPEVFQGFEHPENAFVEREQAAKVLQQVGILAIPGPGRQAIGDGEARACLPRVRRVSVENRPAQPFGLAETVVLEIRWLGDRGFREGVGMARRGRARVVDSLVGQNEAERRILVLRDPLRCPIGKDVGHVAGHLGQGAVVVEGRVVIHTLARHAQPGVKSRPRSSFCAGGHVPFAHVGRAIACLLQQGGELRHLRLRIHGVVYRDAVGVRVAAREQARSRW